ncbi:MAG: polysaccharide biosynthesis/export family protein [Marinilabiliaceae bacterium]|nr:polysaccharide biosynthesis/export family protein [Marinilabiliaceae bacterium]
MNIVINKNKNIKKLYILYVLLTLITIVSCRQKKELTYFNNLTDQEQLSTTLKGELYKIQPNDILYVDIQSLNPEINTLFNPSKNSGFSGGTEQNFGTPASQFLNGYTVDLNGEVNLPILGKVAVKSLTVEEAEKKIQTASDMFLKDAPVKVKLLSFKITVMGEVKKPGVYYNYNNFMTVLEALSMANGETDYSTIKNVMVIRSSDEGSKAYRIDLTKKDFINSQAYFLQPNDVVYIEPDRYKSLKINMPVYTLIMSTISTLVLIWNVAQN